MSDQTAVLQQLVRQAAERRNEAELYFRQMIVAARAAGLALKPIATAAGLSVARVHAILNEQEGEMEMTVLPSEPLVATDDVLVVAARIAYEEYLHYNAYICQPGRSFRDVNRLGFYRHGKIEQYFPEIRAVEDHIRFTRENAKRLRETGSPVDREVADLIEVMLDHHRRSEEDVEQVFLLTPPDGPRTLTLAHPIRHNTGGRGSAWTMGQRYISEAALLRNPETTDDL
jgi:hypothetical protein